MTTRSLLLVDDNLDEPLLLIRALARNGLSEWKIQSIPSGQVALEYLRRAKAGEVPAPELLVLDVKMPAIGGMQILEWLAKELPQLPAVILTAEESLADKLRTKHLGGRAYFVKSPTFTDLVQFIRTVEPGACSGGAISNGGALIRRDSKNPSTLGATS